jgi:2-aminophenol/2-amino-5-chlorophenol 1,6-dioxygenase alpha subunit
MKSRHNDSMIFAIVPGMPHLLQPELNTGYRKLAESVQELGRRFKAEGVERIVYYSTSWLSVLGTSFQAGKNLKGLHVDENWYEFGDLEFDFKVDRTLAQSFASRVGEFGFAPSLVDYEGFPVDTATIVADRLINPDHLPVTMVASHVYSDYGRTIELGKLMGQVIQNDGRKTAMVAITAMSSRYFTSDIDYGRDQIRDAEDDVWNRRILELLEAGQFDPIHRMAGEYSQAAKVDMGFKAFAWLSGCMGEVSQKSKGHVVAYAPVYGTGAAVVEFRN